MNIFCCFKHEELPKKNNVSERGRGVDDRGGVNELEQTKTTNGTTETTGSTRSTVATTRGSGINRCNRTPLVQTIIQYRNDPKKLEKIIDKTPADEFDGCLLAAMIYVYEYPKLVSKIAEKEYGTIKKK